jgi:hypothetical protein
LARLSIVLSPLRSRSSCCCFVIVQRLLSWMRSGSFCFVDSRTKRKLLKDRSRGKIFSRAR